MGLIGIGIDIHEGNVNAARGFAEREGVGDICTFASRSTERANVIVSIDAFEHFSDPAGILEIMRDLPLGGFQVGLSQSAPTSKTARSPINGAKDRNGRTVIPGVNALGYGKRFSAAC